MQWIHIDKECLVVGFGKMEGSHNAENIILYIETLINKYTFDISKIKGLFYNSKKF